MSWSEIAEALTKLEPDLKKNVRAAMALDARFEAAGFQVKRLPILEALYELVRHDDIKSEGT